MMFKTSMCYIKFSVICKASIFNNSRVVPKHIDLTRYFATFGSRLSHNKKPAATNPGIRKRLKALDLEGTEFSDAEMNAVDMESDFMNVDKMYNTHKSELQDLKEQQQLKMVQRKYFKATKEPNMLTWEEKEQIHYLHNLDPQEWNTEKLASSFPISEAAVKKLLKAKWEPSSADRILKYNQSVLRNWKLLKEGKLEIPLDLKFHIEKFASRKHVVLHTPCVPEVPSPTSHNLPTEFASIIESYKTLEPKENNANLNNITSKIKSQYDIPNVNMDDTYVKKGTKNYKRTHQVTLDKYCERVFDEIRNGNAPSEVDRVMLTHRIRKKVMVSEVPQLEDNGVAVENKTKVNLKPVLAGYSEKIRIPEEKWIRGMTYKVDDCYYDDDGEFLYRVPGMRG